VKTTIPKHDAFASFLFPNHKTMYPCTKIKKKEMSLFSALPINPKMMRKQEN
jgi:hypothetical protein